MKIEILNTQNDIVAKEIDGDGLFKLNQQAKVIYQNPADNNKKWFVNSNYENFKSSLDIFHWYLNTVITLQTEEEQLLVVAEFKKKIFEIEPLENSFNSYWNIIIEQAEAGHL